MMSKNSSARRRSWADRARGRKLDQSAQGTEMNRLQKAAVEGNGAGKRRKGAKVQENKMALWQKEELGWCGNRLDRRDWHLSHSREDESKGDLFKNSNQRLHDPWTIWGENWLLKYVLWSPHRCHSKHCPPYISKLMNFNLWKSLSFQLSHALSSSVSL